MNTRTKCLTACLGIAAAHASAEGSSGLTRAAPVKAAKGGPRRLYIRTFEVHKKYPECDLKVFSQVVYPSKLDQEPLSYAPLFFAIK